MIHQLGFRTEIGRSHKVNQDSGGVWHAERPNGVASSLLIVADGVSSGRHSEDASKLVVETLRDRLTGPLEDPKQDIDALTAQLRDAATLANGLVASRPHHSPSSADATTLTAVVCLDDTIAGVWCGDSRVYKLGSGVTRLSRDHSWAEGVVSRGLMTAEQAALDPRAHMITRWMGPSDSDDPGVETFRASLHAGNVVMCCSDGLYMYFAVPYGEEAELETLVACADVQLGVDGLVETAMRRGGQDDITAAVLRVVGDTVA